jgi:hypothetical protein
MQLLTIETFYKEHEGLIQVILFVFSVIIGYITIIQPIISYLITQRNTKRDKRYEIYHELITIISGGDGKIRLRLYRQLSSVYELRNFPEYYPVTKRILRGIKEEALKSNREDVKRLIEEIDLTIKFINGTWIRRKFLK